MARDLLDLVNVKKWRCSWSFVATMASILVLVSVVHLFLFPLTPSFNYFKLAQDSCILPTNASAEFLINLEKQESVIDMKHPFPTDLHGAIVYRGAPWKAVIGCWLAGCDYVKREVNITEIISGNNCKSDCNGLGVCN